MKLQLDLLTICEFGLIYYLYMASKGVYSKKPMWQWILLYLIVGGIIYFVIYYFFMSKGVASPYSY